MWINKAIREEDHHQWYRRMYDSLHRNSGPGKYANLCKLLSIFKNFFNIAEDYVTVRYKTGRISAPTGRYPLILSHPN